MSKLRLAFVVTAMGALLTCAPALKAQENASDYGGMAQTFKCKAVEQGQSRIVAADPPHTILVSLRVKDKKAIELKVAHVEANGERYSPADETNSWHLVTIPGRRDYSWYGMAKGRNLLIHGRLFEQYSAHDSEKRWFYNEEEFEDGLKTADYQSICREEG